MRAARIGVGEAVLRAFACPVEALVVAVDAVERDGIAAVRVPGRRRLCPAQRDRSVTVGRAGESSGDRARLRRSSRMR